MMDKITLLYFTRFAHYCQFKFDLTSFLCNEGELKVIGSKDKHQHDKNYSESRFSIIVLWVGFSGGVNIPMIFMAKGERHTLDSEVPNL